MCSSDGLILSSGVSEGHREKINHPGIPAVQEFGDRETDEIK